MKTKIICNGAWETSHSGLYKQKTYYYDCVFGSACVCYCFDKWWIKVAFEHDHLFNLSFKTHTEAIAHLDKECYKYIQEAIKYLRG